MTRPRARCPACQATVERGSDGRCTRCGLILATVCAATSEPSTGAFPAPRPDPAHPTTDRIRRATTRRTSRELASRDSTRRTSDATSTAALTPPPTRPAASEDDAASPPGDTRQTTNHGFASMATLPGAERGDGDSRESRDSLEVVDPPEVTPLYQMRLQIRNASVGKPEDNRGKPLDYELIELLGEGGMGVVYAARQTALDRVIAIKTIKADTAKHPEMRAKFIAEAAVTGDLDHPNIVPIHELGSDESGALFYAMKRVHGRLWSSVMRDRTQAENLDILMRVADAAAFAHSRGIIHRDLKPENVMVGEFGEVLVMDWGLAAAVMRGGKAERLTHRTIAGTPSYMAPEMARGEWRKIGVASDIYLIGAILFEILTGDPPHARRKVADSLLSAKTNDIRPPRKGGGLMEIALTAMATRPEDRFGSVKAMQAAIRSYQAHAESLALGERAQEMLAAASQDGDYAMFARAIFGFEEAISLWPDNAAARRGASEARFAYANHAFAKGDLDLAASYLDPHDRAHAELSGRVATAREEREHAKSATVRLESEKQARLEAELRQRVLAAQVESEVRREWQLVFADDFSNPDIASRWDIRGGEWEWKNGELRVRGGSPQLVLLRQPFSGDLRIEFECVQDGPLLNDASCFLGCLPGKDTAAIPASGYEFKFGGFDNSAIALHRPGKRLFYRRATALRPGESYRVVAERVGSRLSMIVNGRTVFEVNDDQPLDGTERTAIGLYGWMAESRYRMARVWRLSAPRKADLLETAESHLARGHYVTACDLFTDVLAAADDDAARHDRARSGIDRALFLKDLWRSLPLVTERLARAYQGAKVVLGHDGLIVDLARCGATTLEPLKGLPIAELHCGGNAIESLSPLRGMRLRILTCDRNRIPSLEPLAGMPLSELSCSGNRIPSLEPLAGAPMTALDCSLNRLSGIEPLKGMALTRLVMRGNRVASLEPLRGMPLSTLFCEFNRLADLEPLRGMPLTSVDCSGNIIESLEPLRGMALTVLRCSANRIASLDPVTGMPLVCLACDVNRIADLEPLRGMPLATLSCSANQIESLAPLAETGPSRVACGGNLLTGLAPYDHRPPPAFEFDGPRLSNAELRRVLALWSASPLPAGWALARHAGLLLKARAGEIDQLRAEAVAVGGRSFLYLPAAATWEQARALCLRLGGRLAVFADAEQQAAAQSTMPPGVEGWIGLRRQAGQPLWEDGSAVAWSAWRDDWQAPLDGNVKLGSERGADWRISLVPDEVLGFIIMW